MIRYAVVEGIATATEVSTIGIVYAFIVGFLIYGLLIYRNFDWRRIMPMLIETACLSGAILLIIGCATGMAWGLTQSGFSRALAAAMTGLPGGSATFIAVSIVAFTILGSVLEGIPAIVLFGPLLFPIARAVGVHEVHYAMIIILAMGIGLFAPPFGVGYYAACAIGRVDPGRRDQADLGLSAGADGRPDHRGDLPVDLDRVLVSQTFADGTQPMSAAQNQYQHRIGQDAGQLRAADAAEFPRPQRRRLSRSCQHGL